MNRSNFTVETKDELSNKQKELELIRKNRLQGQCIRSKVKWIEEGEKPSKYFISLESRNFSSKIIPKVEKEDGSTVFNQFEILNELRMFYDNLYQKRETIYEKLKLYDIPKLNKQEYDLLEGPLNKLEVYNFLKKMKNDKSPGPDGLTSEFLKFFWNDLAL